MKPNQEKFAGETMIKEILSKGADAVTEGEKEILRSRINYLTPEEVEKFLGEGSIKATVETEEVAEEEETETETPESEEEVEEVDLESMTVPQLKALAEEQEIDLGSAKTKADIIAVLEESLAE